MDGRDRFWTKVIAKYDRRLRGYCRRVRCTDDEINQIVWDVWQEATDHETQLAESGDQWPVLHAIVRARCAAHVQTYRHEVPFENQDVAVEDNAVDDADERRQRMQEWAVEALERLPDKQRRAVDYRFRWGWSYDIVAAALETAEPTARVHVARALRRLREIARESPPQ